MAGLADSPAIICSAKAMISASVLGNLAMGLLLYDLYRSPQAEVWGGVRISVPNLPIWRTEPAVLSFARFPTT